MSRPDRHGAGRARVPSAFPPSPSPGAAPSHPEVSRPRSSGGLWWCGLPALVFGLVASGSVVVGCGDQAPSAAPPSHQSASGDAAPRAAHPVRPAPPSSRPAHEPRAASLGASQPGRAGQGSEAPGASADAPTGGSAPTRAPKGVWKPLHRVPVVGGCGRACANPRAALRGFVKALASRPKATGATGAEDAARFLNTAELSVDGGAQGEELSKLWRQGALGPRRQRVRDVVADLARGLTPDDLTSLLEAADQAPLSLGPRSARTSLALPGRGVTWRVVLTRRGLEWLVRSIDRR